MVIRNDRQGYCPNCLTNVEHVRLVKSSLLKVIDRWTFRLPELFGLGPWYCISCGKRRLLFPPYRRNRGSYDPIPQEFDADSDTGAESMGNIFLSEVSLVHRSNRAKYYSEKFRDGIVERLLTCKATFSQVRESLEISDLDLQDWIARYHLKRARHPAPRIADVDHQRVLPADSDDSFPNPTSDHESAEPLRSKAD